MRIIRSSRPDRSGFTLIELLVVIAIIGVLVALIMPAVQQAREASMRTQCINNLKQLGLAAQLYHDAYNSFPSGWYCDETDTTNCVNTAAQPWMWNGLTGLLLKLEQENLYNELNFNLRTNDIANVTGVRRTLNMLVCPSNRRAATVNTTTGTGTTKATVRYGPSDYRGNMAAGYVPGCANAATDPTCGIYDNGLTYMNSSVGMAEISDGTSNTCLIGETLTGTWSEANSCCVRTTVDRQLNKPIRVNGVNYYTYWMSKHPGIVNFLKCDGSVSSVTNQIDKNVLVKMMTRNGGEALSADEIK